MRAPRPAPLAFPAESVSLPPSSYIHALWRRYSMPRDALYLTSNMRNARKTSRGEMEWLLFLSRRRDIRSQYTHPGGQKYLAPYHLDGCEEGADGRVTTAYEFLGCLFHGHCVVRHDCPLSEALKSHHPSPFGEPMFAVYRKWQDKAAALKRRGVKVVAVWECEWAARVAAEGSEEGAFVESLRASGRPKERLTLRDALRGGRTEAFHLLYRETPQQVEEDGRQLLYIDVCSLYPHVAIEREFPAGEPRTIIGAQLDHYDVGPRGVRRKDGSGPWLHGLIQCTVSPPDALFYPILPTYCRGKLMYGLCALCLEAGADHFCTHAGTDRHLTDTWTIIEVAEALRCGYELVAVHEILAYERTERLFRDFYLPLARLKLEAEGWPREDMSPEEKEARVRDINDHMPGLDLSRERVRKNPAKRAFAKLASNAALGKLSQNDNKPTSRFVRSWSEVHQLINHHRYRLKRLEPVDQDMCEVVYETREDRVGYHKGTQVSATRERETVASSSDPRR